MSANENPKEAEIRAMADEAWKSYLTTGMVPAKYLTTMQRLLTREAFMRWLPSEPRCHICHVPFKGLGGQLMRAAIGREPSKMNPKICNDCEQFAKMFPGGAEVEISMLFADVRGSTTLAEGLSPTAFRELIDRFYQTATHVLVHSGALIEKLIGDEVAALYVPGFVGPQHARHAAEAALKILHDTGHGQPGGPWIPVGVGVHTGQVYIGSVGKPDGMSDIAVLGDAANTAARLASQAKAGEVLVSEAARLNSQLSLANFEIRALQLKGKTEPLEVRVLPAGTRLLTTN